MTELFTATVERTFTAPAAVVFDAWTDPAVMRRWWHPEAGGSTTDAASDLRVGGAVRVAMTGADGSRFGGGGTYTVVDPPRRLVFTWRWDDDAPTVPTAMVDLRFTECDGTTRVTLTHSGLRDAATAAEHEDGWRGALENLVQKAGVAR